MVSKTAWLKKLLLPNRYDGFYLVLVSMGLYALVGMLLVFSNSDPVFEVAVILYSIPGIVGSFLALGAVVAFGRHSWPRVNSIALTGIVLPLVVFLIVYFNKKFSDQQSLPPEYQNLGGSFNPTRLLTVYLFLLMIPISSWLLFSVIHRGPKWIKKSYDKRVKISRQKLLIGLAGVMLIAGIANNILNATVVGYAKGFTGVIGPIISVVITVAAFAIVVYLPTRIMVGACASWIKWLVSLLALGLLFGVMWMVFLRFPRTGFDEYLLATTIMLGAGFYLLVLVASVDPQKPIASSTEALDLKARAGWGVRFPSIWTIMFVMLLLGIAVFPFRYDVSALTQGEGLEAAKNAATLRRVSNGQVQRGKDRVFVNFLCNFDESTDPDVLELLNDDPCSVYIFSRITPQVDFSKLIAKDNPIAVQFDSGTVTTNQLSDMLAQPASFLGFYGANVEIGDQLVSPAHVDRLQFVNQHQNKHFANVMSAFESFKNVKVVDIHVRTSSKDWPQIIRASQETKINFGVALPDDLTEEQMSQINSNIQFTGLYIQGNRESLNSTTLNWLEHSNLTFMLNAIEGHSNIQFVFDLLFAYPKRFNNYSENSLVQYADLAKPSEDNHFVFETNGEGKATGLFLPEGELNIHVPTMTELKVLSFDESWLQLRTRRFQAESNVDWSSLINLEHLVFSANASIDYIGFIRSMKSLKYLQIPMVDRTLFPADGFDACPSLETIAIMGLPDDKSVAEFGMLPNLEKLTIVDVYDELLGDSSLDDTATGIDEASEFIIPISKYQKAIAEKIPNVDVVVVKEKDFVPVIPDSFKRHAEQLQGRLRAKILNGVSEYEE